MQLPLTSIIDKDYMFIRENLQLIGVMHFNSDGTIGGYKHSNESKWRIEGDELHILRDDGQLCSVWQSLALNNSVFMGWQGLDKKKRIGYEKVCERFILQQINLEKGEAI